MSAQIIHLLCKEHGIFAKRCPLCAEAKRPPSATERLISAAHECLTVSLELRQVLKKELGADFHKRYPYDAKPFEVMEALGATNYRLWSAWAAGERGRRQLPAYAGVNGE